MKSKGCLGQGKKKSQEGKKRTREVRHDGDSERRVSRWQQCQTGVFGLTFRRSLVILKRTISVAGWEQKPGEGESRSEWEKVIAQNAFKNLAVKVGGEVRR